MNMGPHVFSAEKNPLGSARKDPMCTKEGLECNRMDNYHWKTAPYWTRKELHSHFNTPLYIFNMSSI